MAQNTWFKVFLPSFSSSMANKQVSALYLKYEPPIANSTINQI